MLDRPRKELIRNRQLVRNSGDATLVVWIEPWADRFELAPEESLEIVFVGSDDGQPEVLPYPGELVICGWSGSEVIVLKNGRPVRSQATVDEIVRQEFEIALEQIGRTPDYFPKEEIDLVQHKLLEASDVSSESQELACELVSYLICELASHLEPSDAAATMLWQIADRILGANGVVLALPSHRTLANAIWKKGPADVFGLVFAQAISVLPGPMYLISKQRQQPSTRRRAGSESPPGPH